MSHRFLVESAHMHKAQAARVMTAAEALQPQQQQWMRLTVDINCTKPCKDLQVCLFSTFAEECIELGSSQHT